jgi:hypothetical protein
MDDKYEWQGKCISNLNKRSSMSKQLDKSFVIKKQKPYRIPSKYFYNLRNLKDKHTYLMSESNADNARE